MTRIDFYVSQRPGTREALVCRLTEKAYQRGLRVLIHCPDPARIERLDELLWTYREGSFLPHERIQAPHVPDAPILLDEQGADHLGDVLINLADDVPEGFGSHARVLEIIDGDPAVKAAGRKRFKYYRDRGYPIQTHTL